MTFAHPWGLLALALPLVLALIEFNRRQPGVALPLDHGDHPVSSRPTVIRRSLKILFGEFAKVVGNGTGRSQRDRPVSHRLPSESIADPVNGAVGHPTRHAPFGAQPALLILKAKWEFQLHVPVLLEVRHGNRQERDDLLVWVIREDCAHQLLGDFRKNRGRRNRARAKWKCPSLSNIRAKLRAGPPRVQFYRVERTACRRQSCPKNCRRRAEYC